MSKFQRPFGPWDANLILYCRQGFEPDCMAELQQHLSLLKIPAQLQSHSQSAYVVCQLQSSTDLNRLQKKIGFDRLIFPRQWIGSTLFLHGLPEKDRIGPMLQSLVEAPLLGEHRRFSAVIVETADTNQAKQLSKFCRSFYRPLENALRKQKLLLNSDQETLPRLHVFFLDYASAFLGVSFQNNSSPYSMGIPRLKFLSGAPSRAVLKLEEAFLWFLSETERLKLLTPGMHAVDLGAAPGGFSWLLAKRGLLVTAVDHANLSPRVLESGLVSHLKTDGFSFIPKRSVDWMVCDIIDRPEMIANLVVKWISKGMCRRCVFNLKLPMKKRYEEVSRCRQIILSQLRRFQLPVELRFKQLYHDRAEVTGYIRTR